MDYDRLNPDTWQVLKIDTAIPLDTQAKAYLIEDLRNWTRIYLRIPIKLIANCLLALIMTVKRLLPWQFSAYSLMHRSATFFLKNFVTPEACYLIVRHINIGSNIVNFLIDNGPDTSIARSTLYPCKVDDLVNNAFLEHDLILYNFVWDYHQAKQNHPDWLTKEREKTINFASIGPIKLAIEVKKRRWLQILDLESAMELFKVFYSLCLTSQEFERAVLSLQLDENFGLYVSEITGDYQWNHLITNRHPLAPNSPFQAARDLFLHGLMSEYLYQYLTIAKEQTLYQ
ncbi:hypothetical protein [Gloeocapsa sp. PCC 73106]|uniref:DUF6999 family protein n=1 Tax=Gloeocapsa sp. PCC 73106 TaxID=102232 RepID=UPI0002AD141D|nr:hypothetical protein [Gloeocapsa sp. PCC 73106]ELR97387.1 hypothetical protein GLO73106DRAFT_00011960 [Gloeocapsa sp. PCC 73106]